MTNEQEKKLEKMNDQKLLIELAVAFGNTPELKLDKDSRMSIMSLFDKLNLDHMRDYPDSLRERSGS